MTMTKEQLKIACSKLCTMHRRIAEVSAQSCCCSCGEKDMKVELDRNDNCTPTFLMDSVHQTCGQKTCGQEAGRHASRDRRNNNTNWMGEKGHSNSFLNSMIFSLQQ